MLRITRTRFSFLFASLLAVLSLAALSAFSSNPAVAAVHRDVRPAQVTCTVTASSPIKTDSTITATGAATCTPASSVIILHVELQKLQGSQWKAVEISEGYHAGSITLTTPSFACTTGKPNLFRTLVAAAVQFRIFIRAAGPVTYVC